MNPASLEMEGGGPGRGNVGGTFEPGSSQPSGEGVWKELPGDKSVASEALAVQHCVPRGNRWAE